MTSDTFLVHGQVVGRETQHGIAGLRVEAWDKDQVYDDLIASAVTDEAGTFEMAFDQSRFRGSMDPRSGRTSTSRSTAAER